MTSSTENPHRLPIQEWITAHGAQVMANEHQTNYLARRDRHVQRWLLDDVLGDEANGWQVITYVEIFGAELAPAKSTILWRTEGEEIWYPNAEQFATLMREAQTELDATHPDVDADQ